MNTTDKVKRIDKEIGLDSSDAILKEIIKYNGISLKIEIRSNSYSFQCSARISALDTNEREWNIIHSIHHSNMKTPSKLYLKSKDRAILSKYFSEDRRKLINMAKELL
jgi:hypothetical protein